MYHNMVWILCNTMIVLFHDWIAITLLVLVIVTILSTVRRTARPQAINCHQFIFSSQSPRLWLCYCLAVAMPVEARDMHQRGPVSALRGELTQLAQLGVYIDTVRRGICRGVDGAAALNSCATVQRERRVQ